MPPSIISGTSVSRNGGVTWMTDGDGEFLEGTETGGEGAHCIEVDGLELGDRIIADIPTLGQWGLMSLGLLVLILGIVGIRQNVLSLTLK